MSDTPVAAEVPRPIAIRLSWIVGLIVCLRFEYLRLVNAIDAGQVWRFLVDWNIDKTPFEILLVIATPFVWRKAGGLQASNDDSGSKSHRLHSGINQGSIADQSGPVVPSDRSDRWQLIDWILVGGVMLCSVAIDVAISSVAVGPRATAWGDLPPSYHDEYCYLFQAETFALGRTWLPSHAQVPEAFDQMHVLNEGRFASRYFPGTGLWLAPFVILGRPIFGYWLAGAVASGFLFACGRDLGGRITGAMAAICLAMAPGVALFSNLILAHHPTLMCLSIFLWSMVRLMRTGRIGLAIVAATSLAMAALCRPMTAAGIGLPFGVWLAAWAMRPSLASHLPAQRRWVVVAAMGLTITIFGCGLSLYNRSITGEMLVTPYQLYTDLHTPRHVYGFNNVVRGEQRLGPKVIESYDEWAVNLTVGRSLQNVGTRLLASSVWILGMIPLALSAVMFVSSVRQLDARWKCVGCSIVTLHLAHVPYWFTGILDWHYVFESVLPWCLVVGWAARGVIALPGRQSARWGWITAFALAAAVPSYVSIPPLWEGRRIDTAIDSIAFSRLRYARLQRLLAPVVDRAESEGRGVLLLVRHSRNNVHIDYVTNSPTLDISVVRARMPESPERRKELLEAFANRAVYEFDSETGQLQRYGSQD